MVEDLFDTKEKKANAAVQFESLEQNPGWQILVSVVKQNIEVLNIQLKLGKDGETLDDIKRLREKIEDHVNFIETPERLRKEFLSEETPEPDDDPY